AEDGIRDRNVTGVQTCALPISPPRSSIEPVVQGVIELLPLGLDAAAGRGRVLGSLCHGPASLSRAVLGSRWSSSAELLLGRCLRSAERRVGKACGCRWGQWHSG